VNPKRIVIIGAGYAGVMAALRLAGKDRKRQAEITLVSASDIFVERIRLHQLAANQTLPQHSIRKLLGKRPVQFVQGWITALDLNQHIVHVDVQGEAREIGYDNLVYALGSVAAKSGIPGAAEHTYGIGNKAEAAALRERLIEAKAGSRVAVIGAGLTGIETVTEIAETYPQLRVMLVTDGIPAEGFSNRGQAYLAQTFEQMDIQVRDYTAVSSVEAGALHTQTGERLPFDVAVWCGSFEAVPLARDTGLAVNAKGQVLVDPYMRSISHPDVYAAGDSAMPVIEPNAPIRMACATALPMGAHVADNLLALVQSQPQQPFSFHYGGQCVSLGRRRGMVQLVQPDDSPKEQVLPGALGRVIKELICQFAFRSLPIERMFPGAFMWMGKGKQPAGFETWHSSRAAELVRDH
jgi:NADH dehydrogenase